MNRFNELKEEFLSVFSGRGILLLDSVVPTLVFLIGNSLFGVEIALWAALAAAGAFASVRILRKQSLVYTLAGLGGVVLAAVSVQFSGLEGGFYLPGFLTNAVIIVLGVVSVLVRRPLVAWTSHITRRWPRAWYWHPKVQPAYTEVTILWAAAFAAQLGMKYWFYQREAFNALGISEIVFGWPFTIILLVITYLYGLWRLGSLGGPSVEEFKSGAEPPWEGQKNGF